MPDIVRPEYRYTFEKRAFMSGAQAITIAGQYGGVHLYNPAASGVHVVCYRCASMVTNAASEMRMHTFASVIGATTGIVIVNKYRESSPVAAAAEVRFDTDTVTPLTGTTPFNRMTPLQNTMVEWIDPRAPMILEEGEGIGVQGSNVLDVIEAMFEWWEFPT